MARLPVRVSTLAVTGLGLSYWALARTPIQRVSPRVHDLLAVITTSLLVAALLVAAVAATSWLLALDERHAQRRWARALAALPSWVLVAPAALSGSYVAARMSLTTDPRADYWPAFWLWLGSMALLLAAFVPAGALRPRALAIPRLRWRSIVSPEVAVVSAVTIAALVLRVVGLGSLPPLVHVDEEAIGFDALAATTGQLRNMFGAGWGANPAMGFFIYGGFIKLFGASIHSVRLGSAVFGAAAIPAVYLLLRSMFGKGTALTGAVFLVGYHQHLLFSRVGLNVVWDAPAMSAALFFAYRASRDGRPVDFAAAGLVSGASLYLYHGTRAVPIVVLAYLAYVAAFRWRFARANAQNFVLLAVAFLVAATPMAVFYATHQDAFWSRLDQTSIFQTGWFDQQRALGRGPVEILWAQTRHAFGGWFVNADLSPFAFYTPSKPLVTGLAVVPLVAGIVYSALHVDDRRYALLLIAFAVPTFLGGALTLGPPNAQRLVGAMPAVVGLIGVGLWEGSSVAFRWRPQLIAVAAVAAAAALATADAWMYFDAARGNLRWGELRATTSARYLLTLPRETRIYWYGAPEIRANFSPLSLHELKPIELFDSEPAPPRPASATPAAFVFLAGYDGRLASVRAACPDGTIREVGYRGRPVLVAYEVMAPNVCVPAPGAPDRFDDAVALGVAPVRDYTSPFDATTEPGEPQPCGMAGATVWYAFTPTNDGRLQADTRGSSFDTVLAVYTGASIDTLTGVTCNDNGRGGTASVAEFNARRGVTYFFQIGRGGTPPPTQGDIIRFNLAEAPP